jgi:uncharacterized protein (TIGR02145 family)
MGIDAGPPVPDGGGAPCSFTDARDGTVYRCVTIGSATWMAENLRIGTTVVGGAVTSGSEEPCLCDDGRLERFCNQGTSWGEAPVASVGEMNCDNYGGLYSWSEAMQLPSWCARQAPRTPLVDTVAACNAMLSVPHRGICPAGWHLPQRVEWEALLAAAGGVAANLRPTLPDTCYVGDDGRTYCFPWTGTNSTGFSALPSGYRYTGGVYAEVGVSETTFWSSEPLIAIGPLDFRGPYAVSSATFAVSREGAEVRIRVRDDYATSRDTNHDDAALSVRCVRD